MKTTGKTQFRSSWHTGNSWIPFKNGMSQLCLKSLAPCCQKAFHEIFWTVAIFSIRNAPKIYENNRNRRKWHWNSVAKPQVVKLTITSHKRKIFRLKNSETKENNLKLTEKQHEQIKTKFVKNDENLSLISFSPSFKQFSLSSPSHHHHQYRRLSFSFTGDGCVVCFNFFVLLISIFPHFVLRNISFAASCPFSFFFLSFCCFLLLVMCVCCCFVGFPLNLYCFSVSL